MTATTAMACRIGLKLLWLLLLLTAAAPADADEKWVTVRWVVDGDTIILADGRHVRYIGIDAPEVEHRDRPGEPYGAAARAMNRALVDGHRLRLVLGRERIDHYGRVLAYVYRGDGLFINAALVKQGYAHVLPRAPNLSREKFLLDAQREAMRSGLGIWKGLGREEKPPRPFLGNRRSRRFHAPDCSMGQRMSGKNRVPLENQWQAFWQGYAPASECIVFPK